MTPFGFFSIVADFSNPENVIVRARDEVDLLNFRARALRALHLSKTGRMAALTDQKIKIIRTPTRDYACRIFISRELAAAVMTVFMVDELAYTNFKSNVETVQGPERAAIYHDVWATLLKLQKRVARGLARA